MQCGALILCFAAPAPVIDDSYHVCRPSIDFFLVLFCWRTSESCCGGAAFLFFHRAGFKSCSVFSQIASGGLGSRARAFKSNFAHAAAALMLLRASGSFGYSRAGALCVFWSRFWRNVFTPQRERKKSKGNTARGSLLCLKLYFEGMFGGKNKFVSFLRSTPQRNGVEVFFPRIENLNLF